MKQNTNAKQDGHLLAAKHHVKAPFRQGTQHQIPPLAKKRGGVRLVHCTGRRQGKRRTTAPRDESRGITVRRTILQHGQDLVGKKLGTVEPGQDLGWREVLEHGERKVVVGGSW